MLYFFNAHPLNFPYIPFNIVILLKLSESLFYHNNLSILLDSDMTILVVHMSISSDVSYLIQRARSHPPFYLQRGPW